MDVKQFFSTPIVRKNIPDAKNLNVAIVDFLLKKETRERVGVDKAIQKSNVSGWRSKEDLLFLDNPYLTALAKEVSGAVTNLMDNASSKMESTSPSYQVQMYAWANINRRGAYNVVHNHPNHHWAGVYYVYVGKSDHGKPMSGLLEFSDPRPGAGLIPVDNFGFGERIRIEPKEGMLVLFPGWLPHFVHPYEGDDVRISIAFNIKLERVVS